MVRMDQPIRWYILVVIVCVLIGWNFWLPTFLYSTGPALYGSGGPDFNIFYTGGYLWLTHKNPYLNTGFVYPPTSLPFFGLFALFSTDMAALVWMVTYFFVFAVALLGLALTFEGERRTLYISIALLLFFTSYPLLIMMNLGQSDLLVASLAVLSLASQKLKHGFWSASLLAFATLLKGPPILLLVYFVLYRRDLAYLARFLLSTGTIIAVSLLFVPVQLYFYYLTNVVPALSIVSSSQVNQSIGWYVWLLGMGNLSSYISVLGVGLFASFSLYVNRRGLKLFREGPMRNDAMFLMNVLVLLLFGPRTWPANYVWIILPIALFLTTLMMEQVRVTYLCLVGLGTFLLNSALSQKFLLTTLPLATIGNLVLTLSLIPIYVRPNWIIHLPVEK